MAIESNPLSLGSPAPDFALPDAVSARVVRLADFRDAPALLVMFICNHCPYVRHIRSELASLARDLQPQGLAVVAINPNDWTRYPDDSPERMRVEAAEAAYSFPYLIDESQGVARAYRAACTPDFFLYDRARALFYHGQLDESRPKNAVPVTGADLREAVRACLAGGAPPSAQRPSTGCSIKWRAGNEPTV